ncbi:MAG TPA: DUF192 domain-containing protein [Dyella sp.]|uniref:DUF192 domain-containing protein n=1 Tax=Dyella sp. TaxID=1869338 RepID=UPI002F924B43
MNRLLVSAPIFALALLAGTAHAADKAKAISVTLHGHQFSTELALDDASREHGLMDRTKLAADHSMLFVFPDADLRGFWMKNTLIPLDILFFDKNRKLLSISPNVPPCKADPCQTYMSDGDAQYVLELAGGTAKASGIQVGDELTINADVSGAR